MSMDEGKYTFFWIISEPTDAALSFFREAPCFSACEMLPPAPVVDMTGVTSELGAHEHEEEALAKNNFLLQKNSWFSISN